MDPRYERLYDPGQAPVYPLPEYDPMRSLADWGTPPSPSPVLAAESGRPWISPGPPPSASGVPSWAVASILAGSTTLFVVVVWALFVLVG